MDAGRLQSRPVRGPQAMPPWGRMKLVGKKKPAKMVHPDQRMTFKPAISGAGQGLKKEGQVGPLIINRTSFGSDTRRVVDFDPATLEPLRVAAQLAHRHRKLYQRLRLPSGPALTFNRPGCRGERSRMKAARQCRADSGLVSAPGVGARHYLLRHWCEVPHPKGARGAVAETPLRPSSKSTLK
ncbi:hypothetical protein NDU88_001994 [Pleurodeles waltl]|uniref:Uncharacterized protein n=1 Tax=Pleurodeles waltl TaxID=8319 RepID=A0AAV7TKR7_PLEWA|nr:hypothetical protein NDU88_001994 [Pleurodeles waltl]